MASPICTRRRALIELVRGIGTDGLPCAGLLLEMEVRRDAGVDTEILGLDYLTTVALMGPGVVSAAVAWADGKTERVLVCIELLRQMKGGGEEGEMAICRILRSGDRTVRWETLRLVSSLASRSANLKNCVIAVSRDPGDAALQKYAASLLVNWN
jgi:hypothetical protein